MEKDMIKTLESLEDKLIDISHEMSRIYYDNERYFDNFKRFDYMGIDNPPYSHGSQGELSVYFTAEELQDTFKWFNTVKYYAECEGYGIGAAQRGFNTTSPIALLWTRSVQTIKVLRDMAEVTGTKINEQDKY